MDISIYNCCLQLFKWHLLEEKFLINIVLNKNMQEGARYLYSF